MARDFAGRTVVVTGAAGGLGRALCLRFAAAGARIVALDRDAAVLQGLTFPDGVEAVRIACDVSSEADCLRAMAEARRAFGGVDVLVNNAAVLHMAALADTTPEDFLHVVRVNQLGTFLGIRAVVEPMKAAGGGSIVNVSSVDGLRGSNGVVAYASTKWAVRGITRVAALELGRFGIRVNAVCPEAGSAHMVAPWAPPGVDVAKVLPHMQPALAYQRTRPLAELLEDVANVILFLASDESRSCTGSDFPCEGGNTAGRIVKGIAGL